MEILHGAYRTDNPNGNTISQFMLCVISTTDISATFVVGCHCFVEIAEMLDLEIDVKISVNSVLYCEQ